MERLAIGRIRAPHGLDGRLKVESYSGETAHFLTLAEAHVTKGAMERTFVVEQAEPFGRFVLLKLKGIDSPEEARRYSNCELHASRANAASLAEGEYYYADLCECAVVRNGRDLGRIRTVCEGGASDLLEVEVPSGRRYLVPFIDEFVGEVDLERRTVELRADWLLE